MKKVLKRVKMLIPDWAKPILRPIYRIFSKDGEAKSDLIPHDSRWIGKGDYRKVGLDFRNHFIEVGGLQPEYFVLDVGSGMGRMAVPLTEYLSKSSEYWGIEIVKKGVDWCQENISKGFGNFKFIHSNVFNTHYNKNGDIPASEYEFPFQSEYFDFVFLTSVFTHMVPQDLENYLREIVRVLKPGGTCFITYFILNEESRSLIESGVNKQAFNYPLGNCRIMDKEDPEAAIAYDEGELRDLYAKAGLQIKEPIHFGSWAGRSTFLSYQDIVIATKEK